MSGLFDFSEFPDYAYLVMACRETTDQDDEADVVLNGVYLLIEAVEVVSRPLDAEQAAIELKARFSNSEIMTTNLGMLKLLSGFIELKNIESEMKQAGITPPIKDKAIDRFSMMLNWRKPFLTVIHGGVQ